MRLVGLIATILVCAAAMVLPHQSSAQEIDFGKIDKFESLATGTLDVGAPPNTIIDDGDCSVLGTAISG